MFMHTFVPAPGQIVKRWHVIDAAAKPLGRVASLAAKLLQGKHKPGYTPFLDTGDHVIVINVSTAKLTGKKEEQKLYRYHSGYDGGLRVERAKDVRVTTRLVDSPACLVAEEGDMSGHLARLLKQAGQGAPRVEPILEVNPEHRLVRQLASSAHFDDLANILFDQALLAEGGQLDDPAAYVKRVNALLVAG